MTACAPTAASPAYPVNALNAAGGAASQLPRDPHSLELTLLGATIPGQRWPLGTALSRMLRGGSLSNWESPRMPTTLKQADIISTKRYKQKTSKKCLVARQGPHLPLPRRDMAGRSLGKSFSKGMRGQQSPSRAEKGAKERGRPFTPLIVLSPGETQC